MASFRPSSVASQSLIDARLVHKLERLTLHWQNSFEGLVGGHNTSRFAGAGQEFLDHRHFHQGDDLRAVNWRAYLRLEKMFLKMFQIEPRVPVRLLLDISRSMQTGANPKFDYARKLAAALCYVGLVRLDTMCLQPFSSKLGDSFLCGGGRHRFVSAVNFLTKLAPEGQTRYMDVARQFVSKYPQRGLLIIVSDFLDDSDCERPIQHLAEFGHELMLVQLWAPEDRSPPWDGDLELEDAETGERLEIAFNAESRKQYEADFDKHAQDIQRVAFRNSGRYVGLSTETAIEDAIFGSLVRSGGLQ